MNSHVLSYSLLTAVLLLCLPDSNAADTQQNQKAKKAKRPLYSVIHKDGKKAQHRCFKDEDKNGFCDNGSEQKWKCKNNCRLAVTEEKKTEKVTDESQKQIIEKDGEVTKQVTPPCSGCPLAGNCSKGCLALL